MRAIILLLAAALCSGGVYAQVPLKINYQGFLTNPAGTPINTTVAVAFRLYDVPSCGSPVYAESQNVPVTSG